MRAIRDLVERIARECDPERIVLFGSHAYGSPRGDSDVDLLVLTETHGQPVREAIRLRRAARAAFPLDLVVRDPEDARRRYAAWDPVIREALDRGLTVYERAP